MTEYMSSSSMGVSRDAQLRALKLINVVLETRGKQIFEFGYHTMRNRWESLSKTLSLSNRFSLQKLGPRYCTYFQKIRGPSPGNVSTNSRIFSLSIDEYKMSIIPPLSSIRLIKIFFNKNKSSLIIQFTIHIYFLCHRLPFLFMQFLPSGTLTACLSKKNEKQNITFITWMIMHVEYYVH